MTLNEELNQGYTAYNRGNFPEAVRLLSEAEKERPGDPELLSKLGNALKRVGRFEEAVHVHEQLVQKFPDVPEALSDLAAVFLVWGKETEALRYFEQAASMRTGSAELRFNLAAALQHLGRIDEAIPVYRHTLSLDPKHVKAWSNLGSCLKAMMELQEALDCHRHAVELAPNSPDAQWNLSLTELLAGNRAEGFERYEWRRKIPGFRSPGGIPWNGTPVPDRTLTVYAEQGMGDAFQFVRYLRPARERVGRIRWMCRKEMVKLFKEGFRDADEIVPMGQLSAEELSAPLMSLPHLLGLSKPFSDTVPYLEAAPERIEYWRRLLREDTSVNVGIVWQGILPIETMDDAPCRCIP